MRYSVWWLITCSFGLGIVVDVLVLNSASFVFAMEALLVVICLLLVSMLGYVLLRRQVFQQKALVENQLEYLNAGVDGVTLVGRLAKRCGVLQRQARLMNIELGMQQNQLHETNELVKMMLDQMLDATLLIDQYGVLIGMNQRAQIITGYRLEEVQGRALDKLPLIESLSALYEKGWSQQLVSTLRSSSASQSETLTLRDGGTLACQWTLEELTLSIHRYYLVRIYSDV